MPLLGLGPDSALGLIELIKKFEARLVAVVSDFFFECVLVEVESLYGVHLVFGLIFFPQSFQDIS